MRQGKMDELDFLILDVLARLVWATTPEVLDALESGMPRRAVAGIMVALQKYGLVEKKLRFARSSWEHETNWWRVTSKGEAAILAWRAAKGAEVDVSGEVLVE